MNTTWSQAGEAAGPEQEVPWSEIARIAQAFVDQESPATVWPFDRISPAASTRAASKVFIHYFPAYPISFDNKPAHSDFWATQYLSRGGESGKHADVGGYTRQRPLPTQVWKSPYWKEINAAIDVLRAHAIGADGFGVDIVQLGSGEYWDQAERLCAAATALNVGFSFIPEIDAAILAQATVSQIVDATVTLTRCPASYRLADGSYLFIPFAPENKPLSFWMDVKHELAKRGIKIAFVPDLLSLDDTKRWVPISAGLTFWGHKDVSQAASADTVAAEKRSASYGPFWIPPIAVQDARPAPAIFWEAENTLLLRTLWSQAIDAGYRYAHLITWNDYGEGTQFSPSSGSQFVFYDLTAYYIEYFKTHQAPTIKTDAIYYSHRIEIFRPDRQAMPSEKLFHQIGSAPLTNNVEMVALLRAPATLRIELAGQTMSADVGGGLQTLHISALPGRPIFQIIRNGKVVVQTVSAQPIVEKADKATPDYFGGSSTRSLSD